MNTPKTYRRQQLLDIVEAYIAGGKVSDDLLDDLEIDDPEEGVSRLDAAVARVLLQSVGSDLPYITSRIEGEFFSTQRQWRADPELHFNPKLLFSVNWAMGPSQDWLEAFYGTHTHGFDVWIITASHGSDDLFGCLDYAIGVSKPGESLEQSATKIIKDYLARRKRDYQDRWVAVPAFGVFTSESIRHLEIETWGDGDEEQDFVNLAEDPVVMASQKHTAKPKDDWLDTNSSPPKKRPQEQSRVNTQSFWQDLIEENKLKPEQLEKLIPQLSEKKITPNDARLGHHRGWPAVIVWLFRHPDIVYVALESLLLKNRPECNRFIEAVMHGTHSSVECFSGENPHHFVGGALAPIGKHMAQQMVISGLYCQRIAGQLNIDFPSDLRIDDLPHWGPLLTKELNAARKWPAVK